MKLDKNKNKSDMSRLKRWFVKLMQGFGLIYLADDTQNSQKPAASTTTIPQNQHDLNQAHLDNPPVPSATQAEIKQNTIPTQHNDSLRHLRTMTQYVLRLRNNTNKRYQYQGPDPDNASQSRSNRKKKANNKKAHANKGKGRGIV